MLSSISPLGERARACPVVATVTRLPRRVVGRRCARSARSPAALGLACCRTRARSSPVAVLVAVALLLVGLLLDLRGRRAGGSPSWRRQVDEAWLTRYRGWVYGLGLRRCSSGSAWSRSSPAATVYARGAAGGADRARGSGWRSGRLRRWCARCRSLACARVHAGATCTGSSPGWSAGRARPTAVARGAAAAAAVAVVVAARRGMGADDGDRQVRPDGRSAESGWRPRVSAPRAADAGRGHPPGAARLHPAAAGRAR